MDYSNNMKRYIDNISERFASFVTQVSQEAKNNRHDIKVLAEDFYAEYLNTLYGWDLKNANITRSNEPGIDLCYDTGDIIVQVSSDDSYQKIQKSLDKIQKSSHPSGHFYFVAIKATAKKHTKGFTTSPGVCFEPDGDIFDNARLIGEASRHGIEKLKELSELMDKYFSAGKAVQNNNWVNISSTAKETIEMVTTKPFAEALQTLTADYLKKASQVYQPSDETVQNKEKAYVSIDIEETPVLFSVGTRMAYTINEEFYNGTHYVWCAPGFKLKGQPPTSNPWELFIEYAKYAFIKDDHADVINNNKTGIMKGARARKAQGMITQKMYDTIKGMLMYCATKEKFFPVIYVIPLSKVKNYETRCKKVSKEEAASDCSKEYIIEDLQRDEFYLIDLTELQNRIV